MFRCDKRCDGCDEKFGNFVGTKHTPSKQRRFPPSKEERVWMLCDTKPDATHLPKYSKWLSSSMDPSHSIGWQEQGGLFF